MNRYKNTGLKQYLNSIPEDVKNQKNIEQEEENRRVFKKFSDKYHDGICFLCNKPYAYFNEQHQCMHWLLLPSGIRKKHLISFLKKPLSFYRLDCFLRWLANIEVYMTNINDLNDEKNANSFYETTIKYKDIDWSISINYSDIEGHKNAQEGNVPHYHLQIRKANQVIIRFNDVHIPFTDDDLFTIECLNQAPDIFKIGHSFGEGVGILDEINEQNLLEEFDKGMLVSENENTAPFHRDIIMTAPPGKTISGDMLYEAIQLSKETKRPISHIMKELQPEISVKSIIGASDAVPEMILRNKRKKNKE